MTHPERTLEGRVALVTGGGRGIGKTVALTLAKAGSDVVICGRTERTLHETAEEIHTHDVKALAIVADVVNLKDIQHFVTTAVGHKGRIDILVNNAVSSLAARFDQQSDEHWQHHIDVKLMAYIRAAREVLPHMQQRGWGRIVNVGGMTARIVAPLRMTNGVVNAGVTNFTKQFANHVGPSGVTVNCVHPGITATDRMVAVIESTARDAGVSVEEMTVQMTEEIPRGRLIKPQDIANAVMFFCSPLADMVTGQAIAVDGGSSTAVHY